MGAEKGNIPIGGTVAVIMTAHTFGFADMERAFEVSGEKLDDVIKPLITF
jgi:hypothetical protein